MLLFFGQKTGPMNHPILVGLVPPFYRKKKESSYTSNQSFFLVNIFQNQSQEQKMQSISRGPGQIRKSPDPIRVDTGPRVKQVFAV